MDIRKSYQYKKSLVEFNDGPFAEIEINQTNIDSHAVSIPAIQNSYIDDKKALFYSMKQISKENLSFNLPKTFYYQAMFVKDVEDDYTNWVPFSMFYPNYQQMGYEQLRTYFSWRTLVRKGDIREVSVSYTFIYIYELLNNVGVANPKDGLEKLITFWQAFRSYDDVIDDYILQWIKDYHVYYEMDKPFREFAVEHNLQKNYPEVFINDTDYHSNFEAYASISKYNIRKSAFYNDKYADMIQKCFNFIIPRLKEILKEKRLFLDQLVFYKTDEITWTPFSRAIFFPEGRQKNKRVEISGRIVYNCNDGYWTYSSVIFIEYGKKLIGYIMKQMEASLRTIVKFKSKITADINMCDSRIRSILERSGIQLSKIIRECVSEFYKHYTRKVVKVNVSKLKQIREEAFQTQEKLIVPEDVVENNQGSNHEYEMVNSQEFIMDSNQTAEQPELQVSDVWDEFRASLTQIELEALKIVLNKQDIKKFALKNKIMLEVLMEGINQKAMDYIGDTVLELDDMVNIYDDYKENLTKMVIN